MLIVTSLPFSRYFKEDDDISFDSTSHKNKGKDLQFSQLVFLQRKKNVLGYHSSYIAHLTFSTRNVILDREGGFKLFKNMVASIYLQRVLPNNNDEVKKPYLLW